MRSVKRQALSLLLLPLELLLMLMLAIASLPFVLSGSYRRITRIVREGAQKREVEPPRAAGRLIGLAILLAGLGLGVLAIALELLLLALCISSVAAFIVAILLVLIEPLLLILPLALLIPANIMIYKGINGVFGPKAQIAVK